MGLNFSLLWIVTRSSATKVREHKLSLIMCTLLIAESILFSVTAFSKLYLYINDSGFTPLRLQSTWLVCVLFAGCITALYALWSGKKVFRVWLIFSGVTLALFHIY